MEKVFIGELLASTGGKLLKGRPDDAIGRISIDTRTIKKGDYYLAIIGKKYDGHSFIKDAVEKGASGVIFQEERFIAGKEKSDLALIKVQDTTRALGDFAAFYRKKWKIPVVAISGSNGKTTTREMLYSILSKKGKTLSSRGNFNNLIGLPLTLLEITNKDKYAVVELGISVPGELDRLSKIASPDIGIITNIGYTHLEELKNREGVFLEKKKLFDNLNKNGCAVINCDDDFLKTLADTKSYEKITFGLDKSCNVFGDNIKLLADSLSFDLNLFESKVSVKLPVFGAFNVYNAMAASCAAWKLGVSAAGIKDGLEKFSPPEMRMEQIRLASGTILVNDAYNSNPSSVREAVKALSESFAGKEKIVVLGDMLELGERSDEFHSALGEFLDSQGIDKIFLFGAKMKKAFDSVRHSFSKHFGTKEELLSELRKEMAPESVVFFKASRGMALEEVINKLTR